MRLANLSTGLAFPPWDGICYFASTLGHHAKDGYFRIDAMPLTAIAELLRGGSVTVIDGRRRPGIPDGLRFGLTTWCIVFNRAIRESTHPVAPWETLEMWQVAHSNKHRKLVRTIRKLARIVGTTGPAVIGQNVLLDVRPAKGLDDCPDAICKAFHIDDNFEED